MAEDRRAILLGPQRSNLDLEFHADLEIVAIASDRSEDAHAFGKIDVADGVGRIEMQRLHVDRREGKQFAFRSKHELADGVRVGLEILQWFGKKHSSRRP